MRMWMVEPEIMCRQHLIGEYRELFTILGILKLKRNISGYIENDLIEPLSISIRYKLLKKEMINRGYNPQKEFTFCNELLLYLSGTQINHRIDIDKSKNELFRRCKLCHQ